MDRLPIPPFVADDLARLDLAIEPPVLDKLAGYLHLLLETNKQFNLTALREPDAAWRGHIIDSLTILPGLLPPEIPSAGKVVDVGTGGGLPGIPVAIARPDLQLTLVEATGKKAAFLQECAKQLNLTNVQVVRGRAEDVGQDPLHRQQYDAALSRALGPMAEMLEYTLPLVKVGGRLLAMKGPSVAAELDAAADALTILGASGFEIVEAYPEGMGRNTVIVIVHKADETPRQYPRKPGIPRLTPLGQPRRKN